MFLVPLTKEKLTTICCYASKILRLVGFLTKVF